MKRVLTLLLLVACPGPPPIEEAPAETVEAPEPSASAPAPVVSVSAPQPELPAERPLASFTTRFKAGKGMEGRVENITLIAKKFSDYKLDPGAEFSFNAVVGPRTKEAGFKDAPTFFMGEILEGVGGGTCQVSSTLYATLLHVGAQVLERRPHSRPSSYIEPGLDAMVNYPAECQGDKPDPRVCYDLRIKNPFDFPLFIRAAIGEDIDKEGKRSLAVTIFGTGDVPTVETEWRVWGGESFEKRIRRVSYWKNDRKRLKQPGQNGLEGARILTLTWPDGRVETRKVRSSYQPVPEVWEVGMQWQEETDPNETSP
jgi:hypothetical protein